MTPQLTGLHHVSALSAHIDRTHDFYTRVLGMRPVITSVNQDDPGTYHLFAVLDSAGQVMEMNEENNVVMALATLLVTDPS